MFSNDQNVESIAQLLEAFKHYIGLQSEYVRLDVIEKVVRLITAITIMAVFLLFLIIMLIYLSFAAAFALAAYTGTALAFCIVSGAYLLLLLLVLAYRKRLIEKPLVRFLANLLLSK